MSKQLNSLLVIQIRQNALHGCACDCVRPQATVAHIIHLDSINLLFRFTQQMKNEQKKMKETIKCGQRQRQKSVCSYLLSSSCTIEYEHIVPDCSRAMRIIHRTLFRVSQLLDWRVCFPFILCVKQSKTVNERNCELFISFINWSRTLTKTIRPNVPFFSANRFVCQSIAL